MSPRVHYTRAAERDLHGIARYTQETWGVEQRETYLALLEETCEQILPTRVRFAREVPHRPGLRRWRVESHDVYFREVEGGIEIVRILHVRMFPSRHI
ncbi:MAG: type II toxin-antitoxin system RelE/ParE family toxin [Myxococcales bacterium]|nr:type II toxin-antitoxin system RelE/ParE family toxin [Myxococcales bacterium]